MYEEVASALLGETMKPPTHSPTPAPAAPLSFEKTRNTLADVAAAHCDVW